MGCRNSATTANQSASAPTMPASANACSHPAQASGRSSVSRNSTAIRPSNSKGSRFIITVIIQSSCQSRQRYVAASPTERKSAANLPVRRKPESDSGRPAGIVTRPSAGAGESLFATEASTGVAALRRASPTERKSAKLCPQAAAVDACRSARVQGRLAQLGERCSHIAEVTGSSPVSPTTLFEETKKARSPGPFLLTGSVTQKFRRIGGLKYQPNANTIRRQQQDRPGIIDRDRLGFTRRPRRRGQLSCIVVIVSRAVLQTSRTIPHHRCDVGKAAGVNVGLRHHVAGRERGAVHRARRQAGQWTTHYRHAPDR